jgi:hypothetical protein
MAEVDVALAGAPALLLASALVVTRTTHASPGCQMVRTEEHAHIDADLGNENRGDHPVDAGDLHQESVLHAVRIEPLRDARVEYLNVLLSCFEPVQLDSQQEAMMLFDAALEGEHQLVMPAAQLALGKVSHLLS